MTNLKRTLFAALILTVSIIPVFAQSEVEMEEDAEKVHDIYKKVFAIKDFRMPSGVSDVIGKNYDNYQRALDGMTKTRFYQTEYSDFLKGFAAKYAGNVDQDWKVSGEISSRFQPLRLDFNPGNDYKFIMDRFGYLETAGEENALIALKHIKDNGTDPSVLKSLHEIYRVKAIEEAKNMLALAVLFDPGNERIERRAERLRSDIEAALTSYREEEMRILQSRKWVSNVSGTSAGSPASLAAAGTRFMTGLSDWGGNTKRGTKILKVAIIGDWFVAEKDALGRPTRYGLPAAVALTDNATDEGVVRVYEVSMVTKFPKMESNFYGVWVGKVWRMLEKNLPK
ncbi:MAG: hypothetical protein R2681_02910 [Pyrinomonadaceae bacterium]